MTELPHLPRQLREAADAHRPDRERMLARVERAIAAPECGPAHAAAPDAAPREHSPAPWMRVSAAAAAVAAAIAIGGLAVGEVGGDGGAPGHGAVTSGAASATAPRPAPSDASGGAARSGPVEQHSAPHPGRTTPSAHRTTRGQGKAPTRTPSAGGVAAAPDGTGPSTPATGTGTGHANGGVTSGGSVDPNSNAYWTEDDVKVTSTVALTSLTVELRVSGRSGEVDSNSSYTSASGVTTSVSTSGGDLLYRWTLNPGQTLPPGTYTFAGQFDHAARDRATSADRYTVTADGPAGPATCTGGF
ncbi:hypothetical protein [Actinacidiphila sp. bgisy145]|uniref:hypothetical protein n=1 Tax=Actinacidiphila sp. bgisy145 TaxID=3413792 RepID=UPI003EBD1E41